MPDPDPRTAGRLRRLAEELEESGFDLGASGPSRDVLLDEVRNALHPPVFERRVPSTGAIVDPRAPLASWEEGTDLHVTERTVGEQPIEWARRFADGLSSWLLRRTDGTSSWVVFDRPSGSERDLGVLATAFDATIVQRHPSGTVRVVTERGVWRWEGFDWHHEPHVASWVDVVTACPEHGDPEVVRAMLEFAVHDLGALGIGATLVYRPSDEPGPAVEARLPVPPPLSVSRPLSLAPLRHALAQVDGAAMFDRSGALRKLGVRLVPSPEAERDVDGLLGMRHTSGRRYSYDDPTATVVVVSEDGPVTVLRAGEVLGSSRRPDRP